MNKPDTRVYSATTDSDKIRNSENKRLFRTL